MISNNEYASYFEPYIKSILKNNKSLVENLQESQRDFDKLLMNLPNEKHCYSYAKYKWTIKELIQHLIDTERIFCYRALSFARNEKVSLPGFDQDIFVEYSNANQRNYQELLDEMSLVRKSTIYLFKSFSDEDLKRLGIGSDRQMSVRAAGYIIAGHQSHHLKIIKERYL